MDRYRTVNESTEHREPGFPWWVLLLCALWFGLGVWAQS
jgi:hypothetical protein